MLFDRLALRRRAWRISTAAAAALFFKAVCANSGQFDIQPVSIDFSRSGDVTLLALRNLGARTMRLQVEAYAWEQNPDGTLKLSDTDDILYFPQMFELRSGATQNVRVGTTAAPGAVEKTYRIFIEELPEAADSVPLQASSRSVSLRVAPRVGVPVFVRPVKAVEQLTIDNIAITGGLVGFELRNTGTVHLIPTKIRVDGRTASGATAFGQELTGWYILAGGVRQYRLPIPRSDCASLSEITIRVVTADGRDYEGQAPVAPGACVLGAGTDAR
jgi:fimbrial chaperone protein